MKRGGYYKVKSLHDKKDIDRSIWKADQEKDPIKCGKYFCQLYNFMTYSICTQYNGKML